MQSKFGTMLNKGPFIQSTTWMKGTKKNSLKKFLHVSNLRQFSSYFNNVFRRERTRWRWDLRLRWAPLISGFPVTASTLTKWQRTGGKTSPHPRQEALARLDGSSVQSYNPPRMWQRNSEHVDNWLKGVVQYPGKLELDVMIDTISYLCIKHEATAKWQLA